MPNWFPSYTDCDQPGGYKSLPIVAMVVFSLGGLAGLIAAIVQSLNGLAPPLLGFGLCVAGIIFCLWWLNDRLICLGGDQSAIGAIYSLEPFAFSNDIFDTDYSFNLLLWGFTPQHVLPASFVANEWSPAALGQLEAQWPTLPPMVPNVPFADVSNLVQLIVAQPSIALDVSKAGIDFEGQGVAAVDQANPPLPNGSRQHFVLHCEIEGSGMHDILILLVAILALFAAAIILSAIPGVGTLISWLITALALLLLLIGGGAIVNSPATPPQDGGWGGTLNPYSPGGDPKQPVDLAYVFGRWVCDTGFMHSAANELHPIHYMLKIGTTTQGQITAGQWNPVFGTIQAKLDAFFRYINSPEAGVLQRQPENQWTLHPLLDGCEGETPYPIPPPPGVIV